MFKGPQGVSTGQKSKFVHESMTMELQVKTGKNPQQSIHEGICTFDLTVRKVEHRLERMFSAMDYPPLIPSLYCPHTRPILFSSLLLLLSFWNWDVMSTRSYYREGLDDDDMNMLLFVLTQKETLVRIL